jgi:hypothetical protein
MIPEYIHPILRQAIGYFFDGWSSEEAPAILNPWKYGYTNDRLLDLYPEWSEFCLDREWSIRAALDNGASEEYWKNLEMECMFLIEQYD